MSRLIRRAAGLGRAPRAADPDWYTQQYAHCDVLVVGAGAAGLAAALSAAQTGARVILCDEQSEPGGYLLSAPDVTIDGHPAPEWVARVLAEIADRVTILPNTTAFGWFPGNLIGLAQRLDDDPMRAARHDRVRPDDPRHGRRGPAIVADWVRGRMTRTRTPSWRSRQMPRHPANAFGMSEQSG